MRNGSGRVYDKWNIFVVPVKYQAIYQNSNVFKYTSNSISSETSFLAHLRVM
jgi:hypothetical protein